MNWPDLLHQRDGRYTQELRQEPAPFGLGHLPARRQPEATAAMICGFCSTGCSLNAHLQRGTAIALTPTTDYPVNRGMACPKGWEALSVLDAPDRAVTPLVRNERGQLTPIDWEAALHTFVRRMKRIQLQYGPEAVAWLGTGQITTEELAFLGALAKFGMGVIHGDGNTRQCMATSVVAYKQAFGFDAPPYTYRDLEESDCLVFVGANPCLAHPILWERVHRNRHRPDIVCVDPRRTETAMASTLHLAIQPKSDLVLFYGLARLLIERDWIDRPYIAAHTSGFEAFAAHVAEYPVDRVLAETGLTAAQFETLARLIHERQRVSFWWTMGVNQSYQGVRTAQSLINLALLTGNMGRPGTGANSLTGQCNAMGSRLFSNTTNLFGGRDFANPHDRQTVADILRIPVERIPSQPSWSYHEILKGILDGKIKGLWVVATNPLHSWINQHQAREILSRLEFLVVQDMYTTTETAQACDLLLPAAGWGEKEGTFINSERRIGVIRPVRRAPGQALSDFRIFQLIARAWGVAEWFTEWKSPSAVFQLLKRLSAGQPCDITGIRDYQHLDEAGGIQWPFPAPTTSAAEHLRDGQTVPTSRPSAATLSASSPPSVARTERRLFEDGRYYTPDGRARFCFEAPKPLPEPPNHEFPLVLLTGRGTAVQWHTQTRTAKSATLRQLAPETIYVEINPADARRWGIQSQQLVTVASRRATITARAFLTPTVPPGQVFIPMHYPTANQLTDAVFDPYSKQPSYKACAVRICRAV
jgi:assimilatory nitrate reductase catalytic subunit